MVVTCHACETKFRVDDSKIGARGVKVRCSKCQTMIIVKPEATQEIATPPMAGQPPEPQLAPPGQNLFGGDEDETREPTKVMNAPLMNQMLQQSGDDDDDGAPPNPLAQMPLEPPPVARPPPSPPAPPPIASQPPPLGAPLGLPTPPPLAPPPIKSAPPPPPTLNAAIGTEKPAGAWQTSDPLPPATTGPPLGDDLFSDPFASPPPSTPADDPPQRFADLQPSAGPSLELDLPTKTSPPPPADDPLAGMPKFDQQDDAGPQFEGTMSEEGTVTKPTALVDMQEERTAVKELPREFREKELAAAKAAAPAKAKAKPRAVKSRKVVAIVGYAAIALLVIAGLFGEYMLFRAGGYEGLLGHADRLSAPSTIGVELGRVTLAPYISELGQRFVLVRGEIHNKNTSAAPAFTIDVALAGKKLATAVPGSSIDVVALHKDGRVDTRTPPDTGLGPNETKQFVVAIIAPAETANIAESLTFSLVTK